jgi:hypothetical protein
MCIHSPVVLDSSFHRDAWKGLVGMSKSDAQRKYVEELDHREPRWQSLDPADASALGTPAKQDRDALQRSSQFTPIPFAELAEAAVLPWEHVQHAGWHYVPLIGKTQPPGRYRHTMTACGSSLILFGGCRNARLLNDVHRLTAGATNWERVEIAQVDRPAARAGHTTSAVGDSLVVLGGRGKGVSMDIVDVFDLGLMRWRRQATAGTIPALREGHTAFTFGHRVYITGGEGRSGQRFDDVYFIDVDLWEWSCVATLGPTPIGRSESTITLVGSSAYLFGGMLSAEQFVNDLHRCDDVHTLWPCGATIAPGSTVHALGPLVIGD